MTPLHKPVERAPNRPMGFLYGHAQVHQETERAQDPGQGQVTMDKAGAGLIAAVGYVPTIADAENSHHQPKDFIVSAICMSIYSLKGTEYAN